MTKQEIRTLMKELKSKLSESQIHMCCDTISTQLLQTAAYIQCKQLFCYVSFNQEVITTTILKMALAQKKKVAIPKIIGDEMKFFYINTLEELKPGILGILEPITVEEAIPRMGEQSLVVVPGLAFDLNRNRIGYGKGYYDGYFLKYKEIPMEKIALAYDFQVLDVLPVEDHDKQIDQIITQTRIII